MEQQLTFCTQNVNIRARTAEVDFFALWFERKTQIHFKHAFPFSSSQRAAYGVTAHATGSTASETRILGDVTKTPNCETGFTESFLLRRRPSQRLQHPSRRSKGSNLQQLFDQSIRCCFPRKVKNDLRERLESDLRVLCVER